MKVKSKFFSLNAKLALMLVAICGMFASCYEKEEIDVPTPSTPPAKYYVKGIVTDATTGAVMTAFTVNGQSFTPANGEYSLQLEATGVQTITIKADNYITLSKSIDVKALPNGETGTYVVDAALEPVAIDIPDPEYMTNQYNINGTLYDIDGNKVKFATGDKVTIEDQTVKYNVGESTFTVENVTPGNYIAFVNVAGYTKTYAQIVITEAPLKEGTGVNTIVTRANVVLQKIAEEPEPEPTAKYYIEGNIWGANNVIVDGATVEISLTNGQSFTPSINNGYYKQEIPAEYVGPTVLATVKVSKSTYYPFACSFLMVPVSAGQTSVSTVNITLIPINKDTTEDGSIGGNTNLNPVENGKTEVKDKDVIAQEEATPVVKEDGTEVKVTINDVLDAMEEATGETVTADKITVTTTTELNKDLVSDIVNADGTVQQVKDIVSLTTSAVVIYTQNEGEGSTVAQNINVSRDLATEKAEAAVRTYEGTPKGVVFATPLNITFGSEIATTEKADYLLPVLYYNETNKTWVEDKVQGVVNYAMPQDNGQFKAEIRHFSKFKFGFTSKIDKSKEEAPLAEEFKPYPCFTGNYDQIITVKGQYKGGSRYIGNTPQLEADAKLTGVKESTKKHVVELLQKMIKADNMNILPQPNYKDVAFSQDMSISPNQQIEGFTITRSEKETTYSITVIKADRTPVTLTVTVASVVSYKIAPKQTPSHGHGHGDDLNAGGGIVDLD